MPMPFDNTSDDEDFTIPLHPIQDAMVDCIRDQIEAFDRGDKLNKFILHKLSVERLRDVISFIESFDPNNLSE